MRQELTPSRHVSDRIVKLCTSGQSVSSLLAEDPTLTPGDAWDRLYGDWKRPKSSKGEVEGEDLVGNDAQAPLSDEDLERAASCGKWGPTRPSELFLKV